MNGSYENEFNEMCRICFNRGDFNIYRQKIEIDGIEYDLMEILKEWSTLQTYNSHQYPSMICNFCLQDVVKCFQFIQKIRMADNMIHQGLVRKSAEVANIIELTADTIYEDDSSFEPIYYDDNISDSETGTNLNTIDVEPMQAGVKMSESQSESQTHNFILNTNSVSSMMPNISPTTDETQSIDECLPPLYEIPNSFEDDNCFLITKFVPQTQNVTLTDNDSIDMGDGNNRQVRMFGMEAVEVKADTKVELVEGEESNIDNANTVYMCQYCPRAFATSYHLITHQRKSHVCQFCMSGFEKVSDLHEHIREEHKVFKCALCKKDFSSNSNLRQHMKKIHNVMLPANVALLCFKKKDSVM